MLHKSPSWNACLDEININNLSVECVVGIYPSEKVKPQKLDVDLTLFIDTREAARSNSLTKSVDYAALSAEICFILQNARYKLLETAAEAICHYVLAPPPQDRPRGEVKGVAIEIRKPSALAGDAVPSLKIRRHRSEILGHYEDLDFGQVYMIHSSADCSLYRLTVPAHSQTRPFYHESQYPAAEMPVSSGLALKGKSLEPGVGASIPSGFLRSYHNTTDEDRTVLCVAASDASFHVAEIQPKLGTDLSPDWQKSYYQAGRSEYYF